MISADVLYLPIRELASRIQTQQLDPVELTQAYLARLDALGSRLGAVVTVTRERALREAREARDEVRAGRYRGPLHGIPYGVEDVIAAAGYPTTWGAQPYRDQHFDRDAVVVQRLRTAGAIIVAKLATVELAGAMGYQQADASFTGPGRNPWNQGFWSGGSSTGPGAAVAAALVPFAVGLETWGSVVTPAAFSGVTGLCPTYGRVSRQGAMTLSETMDKLGPLCRTADDCGLVLRAVAGQDAGDSKSRSLAGRFRIGVLRAAAGGAQPEVRRNFGAALEQLSTVAELVPDVALPAFPYDAAASLIINAEAASAFEELIDSGRAHELTAPEGRIGGYAGQMIPARDYLNAIRIRAPAAGAVDRLFAEGGFDALAHPTRATVAYPVGKRFASAYPEARGGGEPISAAGSLLGLPSLALPSGFGRNDLPTSISFTGRAWREDRLLALGRAYQERTDWHTRRPPI